jgi:hypothetical protein
MPSVLLFFMSALPDVEHEFERGFHASIAQRTILGVTAEAR